VRSHPDCRQSAGRTEKTTPRKQDPELRELFALAAAQARELAEDLERLRALRSGAQR
jgi:hypothetical protein